MAAYNKLNEVLKAKEKLEKENLGNSDGSMRLDDTQRVKVLSPGRLVFKRFIRNRLAIVGTVVLIAMFLFSFLGPLFYPYGQRDRFYKYGYLNIDYAYVEQRSEFSMLPLDEELKADSSVTNFVNAKIKEMLAADASSSYLSDKEGNIYCLSATENEKVYTLAAVETELDGNYVQREFIADFTFVANQITYSQGAELPEEFWNLVKAAVSDKSMVFTFEGSEYAVELVKKPSYAVYCTSNDSYVGTGASDSAFVDAVRAADKNSALVYGGRTYHFVPAENGGVDVLLEVGTIPCELATTYVFDAYDPADVSMFTDEFKVGAIGAVAAGSGSFECGGNSYTVAEGDGHIVISDSDGVFARLSTLVVRRETGEDSLPIDFKDAVAATLAELQENNLAKLEFNYMMPEMNDSGDLVYDENGDVQSIDTEITLVRKNQSYELWCEQMKQLIDIYAPPSLAHPLGTDGDGYDILARSMYGGQVSLMVGFVVVILETLLGVIMGGIAGYFGGWIDSIIMRIVDIFYCIPSTPILIIIGAFLDDLQMNEYVRLIWMMAVLGFLGWAGVARLVRGQILSLREQEFMMAAEATGLKVRRRIYRHLVPNVMPQLIVTATMGLGSVILIESTLSFLGLGVKHPLATWGTMINSVATSTETMTRYAYIWIPVGMLICFTVIAFNFVGDGLRDAFDPKMKR